MQGGWLQGRDFRADGLGGERHRRDLRRSRLRRRFLRQGHRAPEDVCRPGRDRDPERTPVQRNERGARTADRGRGDPACHLELAHGCAAGARCDRRASSAALRRLCRIDVSDRRRYLATSRVKRAVPGSRKPCRLAPDQSRFHFRPRAARTQDDRSERHARGGDRIPAQRGNRATLRPPHSRRGAAIPGGEALRHDSAAASGSTPGTTCRGWSCSGPPASPPRRRSSGSG